MGACPRLTITKDTGTVIDQPVTCSPDIRYLVTDMMHPAIGVTRQKGGDGRGLTERFHQFYLTVGLRHKHNPDAMFRKLLRRADIRAKCIPPARSRCF